MSEATASAAVTPTPAEEIVDCFCECVWCAACPCQETSHCACFEARWDNPLPFRFHPHDSSGCRHTAAPQRWSSCPTGIELQDDPASTLGFLSSPIPQEARRCQHSRQHCGTFQEFPQHRARSCKGDCPLGFSFVQERRSFKLEQVGQACLAHETSRLFVKPTAGWIARTDL